MDILIKIFGEDSRNIRYIEKDDNILVSLYDILNIISDTTGVNNPSKIFSRLKFIYDDFKILELYKFKGQGQKLTPVLSIKDLHLYIKIYLSYCQTISINTKNKWLEKIGETNYIISSIKTENELFDIILASFKNYKINKHYYINPYYVDLYFIDENIVIECDEYDHIDYDKDKEIERTKFISEKLNCSWIRFNPYEKKFNIGDIIYEILNIIKKTNLN